MSTMPKFEIYVDAAEKFRWRLKAPNGQVIATSEAYDSKDGCVKGIKSVKTNAPRAEITDTVLKSWKKKPSKPFKRRKENNEEKGKQGRDRSL